MRKDQKLKIGMGVGLATYFLMVALFPTDSFAQAARVFIVIALAYLASKGRNWARILLGLWFGVAGATAILALFASSSAANRPVGVLIGGGFAAGAYFVLTGRREAAAVPDQDRRATSISGA